MEKPIRILMINYKMQCAGIESFIMNIYRNIDRNKVQFDFLVHYEARQFYDDEIEALGGKIYRLFIKYIKDLNKFFGNHPEYKIVHGHMESFGIFYLRAAYLAGIPYRIAHSHIAQKNKGLKGAVKNVLNKGYKKYATALFACSEEAGEFIFGKNTEFKVLKNAIDIDKFVYKEGVRKEVRNELQIQDDTFVIGHVGRFNEQKNHKFLVDIFKAIEERENNVLMLLMGDGNLKSSIEDQVHQLGLDEKVKFLGVRSDVDRIYQAMDVFVMPSLFEGLPVSGIEAQAAGLPCIFSDRITEKTKIIDAVSFLPLENNIENWQNTILSYYQNYERQDEGNRIRNAGYDIKKQANELMQYYIKLASKGD